MALEIGITGGIGSGKSTVAEILRKLGYPVYEADQRARFLMNEDEAVKQKITRLFGEDILGTDGNPDRKKIADRVFADKELLGQLNAIIHPATLHDFETWKENALKTGKKMLFKEAAILFEAGAAEFLDGVIEVYAPESLRLERVCSRDGTSREAVISRMKNQWPESDKIRRSDFIIFNDGEHALIPQVLEAEKFFLAKGQQIKTS